MYTWLLVLILAAAPTGAGDPPAVLGAAAAFERLKELAGDWEATTRKGGGPLRVHYRVTQGEAP